MSQEHLHEVRLQLDDIGDLFADPEPDADRYVSGMDYLYSEIRTYKWRDKFKVTIELPQEKITEGLLERTRAKVKRYCQFKVEQSHKELIVLHQQGVGTLWIGLIVLIVCLTLAFILTLLSQSEVSGIAAALFQVVAVLFAASAGWVALWMPAETFLYDWWPFRQDIRTYRQIAEADLVIRVSEGGAHGEEGKVEQGLS